MTFTPDTAKLAAAKSSRTAKLPPERRREIAANASAHSSRTTKLSARRLRQISLKANRVRWAKERAAAPSRNGGAR